MYVPVHKVCGIVRNELDKESAENVKMSAMVECTLLVKHLVGTKSLKYTRPPLLQKNLEAMIKIFAAKKSNKLSNRFEK